MASAPLLVVNLIGGPGCGKSTVAAHVFAELKWRGVVVELVNEYAKELTWDGHEDILRNQYKIFGEQLHRVERLVGKVEVAITDSPFILSALYHERKTNIKDVALMEYRDTKYEQITILLQRMKEYVKVGRNQTEEEARQIDVQVQQFLNENNIEYLSLPGEQKTVSNLVMMLMKKIDEIRGMETG